MKLDLNEKGYPRFTASNMRLLCMGVTSEHDPKLSYGVFDSVVTPCIEYLFSKICNNIQKDLVGVSFYGIENVGIIDLPIFSTPRDVVMTHTITCMSCSYFASLSQESNSSYVTSFFEKLGFKVMYQSCILPKSKIGDDFMVSIYPAVCFFKLTIEWL